MEPTRTPAVRTAAMSVSGGGPGAVMSRAPMSASSAVDPNRIYQEVMQHKGQAEEQADPLLDRARSLFQQQAGRALKPSFPIFGRVPLYNPAQDTQENFEQHLGRLVAQIESLRSQGALHHEILAFRLQRRAELDQMFPKQALRMKSEEDWKASALRMKEKGVPPEELRKYLKRKTTENLLPTPSEIKSFIERRKEYAAQIAAVSRDAGGPVPQSASPAEAVRGQSVPKPPVQPGAQPRGMMRAVVMQRL